ncbi:MAG: EAL domain-containing protein [Azoarcus sp.]|jgi:EAL domain-containing protein (putative c-di-GMP-specific phosphodiesterase class I)/GGDEF domain-containing protein|nr:EAL domain-containing protein [Azoarcus sp.]
MSLIKQLWIAIVAVTLLALGGSLVVSTLTARQYLEQQLNIKNSDNATALALSLSSQRDKDPVTIELQLASQFDTGYYRSIRLVNPDGGVIVDFHADPHVEGVPDWFVRLASIAEHPGIAHVQDGWRQFGTLTVESHTGYVYAALWNNTRQLLSWFCITAGLAGILGSFLLGRITAPLRTLVNHAQAIGERRFITTQEPRTAELKVVVRAMNALSERVRQMLADEAQRLENLRRQVQEDAVTGLLERRQFLNAFSARLSGPDTSGQGALLILRVRNLNELNRDLGRIGTDKLLRALAGALGSEGEADQIGGRLNGSDFVLLAPASELAPWAAAVAGRVHAAADSHVNGAILAMPMAAVPYSRGDTVAAILAHLDTALAEAELEGDRALKIEERADAARPARAQEQWREILTKALARNGLRFETFPVRTIAGELIHNEAQVDLGTDDGIIKSGDFLPWAARLGLIGHLNQSVAASALEHIRHSETPVAITISAQALQDGRFVTGLIALLRNAPDLVQRLWMEIPEESAVHDADAFHAFCLTVKPFDCKLGIKHAGPRFSALGDLHDLGLDYLKVDMSLLRDIDDNKGNQAFVRSLVMLAHTLGLIAIAEGIDRPEQQAILADLGFDGLAGPTVT